MKRALVSIVMPTFKRSDLIGRAVSSVLAQSYDNWELLVVLDGPEQATERELKKYKDSRIRLIKKRHSGAAACRNAAIRASSGQYIAYCDDDDEYYPDHLKYLVAALEDKSEVGLVYGDCHIDYGTRLQVVRPKHRRAKLERGNYLYPLVILHRRACVERIGVFDETLTIFEDWEFLLRLSDAYPFRHVPKLVGKHNIHGGNICLKEERLLADNCRRVYAKRLSQMMKKKEKVSLTYFRQVIRVLDDLGKPGWGVALAKRYHNKNHSKALMKLIERQGAVLK
ncbi:MAG: glycosyltransferase [Candidatus Saganbacteria bacterium]|nr:glycosyltransferase [Candidatus Saganbacteria bacterium]